MSLVDRASAASEGAGSAAAVVAPATERWDTRPYLQRAGDALSQIANVVLADGMPDESLSGRSYRNTVLRAAAGKPVAWRWRFVRTFAEGLLWPIDRGRHTELAYWQDVERSTLRAQTLRGHLEATL